MLDKLAYAFTPGATMQRAKLTPSIGPGSNAVPRSQQQRYALVNPARNQASSRSISLRMSAAGENQQPDLSKQV